MKKVFIDTDIILDLLSQREPFYRPAAELFSLLDNNKIEGVVSSLIFSNLYYILKKHSSRKTALQNLLKLKALVTVASVDDMIISLALASNFNDFEDAIQYYTALKIKTGCLITRNIRDYKESEIVICTAEEFLKTYKQP